MPNESRDISPLLPERHPTLDFFSCDVFDATPKSDTASMEHPLFSLSTRADHNEKEYRSGENWLKIAPSKAGCATVHDRDVLIYCISQLMAALNDNREINRKLRFHAHDMLTATNRETSGEGYRLLKDALTRLRGTQIETNITTGGKEVWETFGFIDNAKLIRETRDGRMEMIEITLSEWVFNAIRAKGGDLLTISRGYFRLRKPLERRLYEIARKNCGTKNSVWKQKMTTLHEKTGSRSTLREFRRMVTAIIDKNNLHGHIPDYTFELKEDTVYIRPRPELIEIYKEPDSDVDRAISKLLLKTQTYENARKVSGGYDLYFLEGEWRRMLTERQTVPNKPDGSYIGFVKWYVKQHGRA